MSKISGDADGNPARGNAMDMASRRVLLVAWRLVTFIGIPVLGVVAFFEWRQNRMSPWLIAELLSLVAVATVMPYAARAPGRAPIQVLLAGFGLLTLFSLLHFGPIFGVGIYFLAWVLATVFFNRSSHYGVIVSTVALAAVAWTTWQRIIPVGWRATGPQGLEWGRVLFSSVVLCGGAAYLLRQILKIMEAALAAEASASSLAAQAHLEREAMIETLAANQRLEALRRLAGGVAHDFNNSLAVLTVGMDMLSNAGLEGQSELVTDMRLALRGAKATTQQLLAFARQGSAPGANAPVDDVVRELVKSLARIFPETLRLQTDCKASCVVPIGVGELEQCLLNLALNARDAMPEGGTIMFRTELLAAATPACAVIEVLDSGSGMPEDVRRRSIDPFFTTKRDEHGTGLGLGMVHATVTQCGGTMEIRSAVGSGTRVRIVLPVTMVAQVGAANEAVGPLPGTPLRVLLVEDQAPLRAVTRRLLEARGHTVTEASSVAQAMRALQASDAFDLLLTDAVLTDGGPEAVIRAFRAHDMMRPTLVYSGYVRNNSLIAGIEHDAYVFLQKPFGEQELLAAVAETMRPGRRTPQRGVATVPAKPS